MKSLDKLARSLMHRYSLLLSWSTATERQRRKYRTLAKRVLAVTRADG